MAGWLGRLSLELSRSERGTELTRSHHEGPLRVQRVLEPEGPGHPHIYLLHPPGGVVGGDRLETRVQIGPQASVLLTTPAAQKLYRSQGKVAVINNRLELGAQARLEWLPSETLAFSGAQAELATRVELELGAAFIGWDQACFGMPARDEAFVAGRVVSRFEIYRAGAPLLAESLDLGSSEQLREGAFALRGQPVISNLYAVPATGVVAEELVTRVRELVEQPRQKGLCSVSSLGELLVVRGLGPSVEASRAPLLEAWEVLRPALIGRPAVRPRIWAT